MYIVPQMGAIVKPSKKFILSPPSDIFFGFLVIQWENHIRNEAGTEGEKRICSDIFVNMKVYFSMAF